MVGDDESSMGKVMVSTGRGGVGKTTFVALAARYLESPILLIDLDPDQSLADMVGVDLQDEGIKTVSDILYNVIKERKTDGRLSSMPLPERTEYLLQSDCLYEGEKFDLITLGAKLTAGCYCVPDDLLKGNIPRLAKNYSYVVIDSPAGLEHLNRKVVSDIDDLFVLLDASSKSMKHIDRVKDITESTGISYDHFYLVGNYEFDDRMEEYVRSKDENYLGKVEFDSNVKECNLNSKSLLDLPEDSPACSSIKKVLANAGYPMT